MERSSRNAFLWRLNDLYMNVTFSSTLRLSASDTEGLRSVRHLIVCQASST